MPVSTFLGLQTSLRGLLAHQRALDVTGHNVANASTQGYSRQELVLGAAPALRLPAGALPDGSGAQLGVGVDALEYRRVRDGFLDLQFRAQSMSLGDAEARARSLDQVELAIAEPGPDGLAAELAKLWSAFANLHQQPESLPARQALVERAKTVAARFGDIDAQLSTVRAQAAGELAALTAPDTGKVALIAAELESVGEAIRAGVTARQAPNDLMDRRDQLLDQLSSLGQVSVVDHGDGGVAVLFAGTGVPLVDDSKPAGARVVWPQALDAPPGGRLGALQELSRTGGTVDAYRAELATVAGRLATAVNELHRQGPGGRDFFAFDAARGAAGLSVAVTAVQVDAGRPPARSGANDLALEIAALQGGPVDDAYGAFVARVGAEARLTARHVANAEALAGAVDDRRQSTSGVSLDEEMTNLVRFQRGYQASARAMSTLDEMLDTLINRTGRVGL